MDCDDCCTDEEGYGITPVPMPQVEGEVLRSQVINNRQEKGLNHSDPDLHAFDKAKLADEMKDMLREVIDFNLVTDEVLEAWDQHGFSFFFFNADLLIMAPACLVLTSLWLGIEISFWFDLVTW